MSPVLAGLLPLIITASLALIVLVAVGVASLVALAQIAHGDLEPDDDEGDDE